MRVPVRSERTAWTAFARTVEADPAKTFLIDGDRALSYGDVAGRAEAIARGATALGLGFGDTCLIMLPNVADYVALWLGLARAGIVEVPINTAYRGAILRHILADSLATTLVIAPEFLDRIAEIEPPDRLRRLVIRGDGPVPADLARRFEVLPFEALLAGGPEPPRGPGYTDLAAVMYTSGTTGPSKGVMIAHAHAYEYTACVAEVLDLGPADVYYAALPLFHIGGQWAVVYASILGGGAVALKDRFSVSDFWADVARTRANTTLLLGAMCNFLWRQPPRPDDAANTLEKALVVPLIPEIRAFCRRFGLRATTNYGSTEVCVPLRAGFEEPKPRLFDLVDERSCGRVVSDRFEVRIVDEHDEEVPHGRVGELVVRPKAPWIVMAGYWNDPEKTVAAWRNLWLHSGDAMYRDEAGNFYFVDRLKDAIRRRGENISSVEVENEVNAHPAVLECAVIPVPSEHTEDEVKAVVVLKPGTALAPAELAAFLARRTADFMVPRYIEIVDSLPKTPTGKIQKFPLRERPLTPATWDRLAEGRSAAGSNAISLPPRGGG
jgi:crotonobetaine/carnitine-CoA ligase